MNTQIAPTVVSSGSYAPPLSRTAFLDDVLAALQAGRVESGMIELGECLYELYLTSSEQEWQRTVQHELLQHPLHGVLMQDPLTARAFAQPHGYAGDASLLDMVYFPSKTGMTGVTPLGQQLYRYTSRTSLSRALKRRMNMIARLIDEVADKTRDARVLSVAGGHCREAEYSHAVRDARLGQFVVLDHDVSSLETMERDYGIKGVIPACLSVLDLIKGKTGLGQFDLIYSAGLYDYLDTRLARRLTRSLYDMLAPGGKLMLINIASDYREIGYLESYMNWSMIGRDRGEVLELASEVGSDEQACLSLRAESGIDSHYHILEIDKA